MRRSHLHGALILLALNVPISGCMLVGYGSGAMVDANNRREFGDSTFGPGVGSLEKLAPGGKIELVLRNGEIVEGEYLGIEQLPGDDYAERYVRARRRLAPQVTLPELGDTVTLTHIDGGVMRGEFVGFEYRRWVVYEHGAQYWLATTHLADMSAGDYCDVSGEALDELFLAGELPTLSAMAVAVVAADGSRKRGTKRLIPLESIQSGTYKPTSGRMAGGFLGLAADMALGAAAVAAVPNLGVFTFGGG